MIMRTRKTIKASRTAKSRRRISASSRFSRAVRPVRASRPIKANARRTRKSIMAGAGSGITLILKSLDFTNVPNGGFYEEYNDIHDYLEPVNGACKGTIEIKSIGTYYNGGNPNIGEIPVNIYVREVIPDDESEVESIMYDSLKSVVDAISDVEEKAHIGGGWTRSTFNGDFETDAYSYAYGATLKLKVEIVDKELAKWLDEFAHGDAENFAYDVCINGDPIGMYYESEEDAIETAEKYAADPQYEDDEITVIIRHEIIGYDGDIMEFADDDFDVVWNSNDYLYE